MLLCSLPKSVWAGLLLLNRQRTLLEWLRSGVVTHVYQKHRQSIHAVNDIKARWAESLFVDGEGPLQQKLRLAEGACLPMQ